MTYFYRTEGGGMAPLVPLNVDGEGGGVTSGMHPVEVCTTYPKTNSQPAGSTHPT